MPKKNAQELTLIASPEAYAVASFTTVRWLAEGLVALGVLNPAQVRQLLEWAIQDAETVPKTGAEAAAVIRSLMEAPSIKDTSCRELHRGH